MQATDFEKGFLGKAASDIDHALKAAAPVTGSPNVLRLAFKQTDAVASGVVALVSMTSTAQRMCTLRRTVQ